MDISESPGGEVNAALETLRGGDPDSAAWPAAMGTVMAGVDERPDLFDALCGLLRDDSQPAPARRAVLSALQELSFTTVHYPAKRPEYLDSVRSVVDDADAALRRRALGILAREKDSYAQQRLMDGLEGRGRKLVPDAKAIQFLGYDLHAEHFPILRRVVERPPNAAARREAVRLLAADPASADLLSGILDNKTEQPAIRAASALALQAAAPGAFEQRARRIVLDDDEDDDLQAISLSALGLFAAPGARRDDAELGRRAAQLRQSSTSAHVKKAADDYLSKHER